MDERAKRRRLQEFEELCRSRGLPLTLQRRTILTAVLDRDDHPTADQVHEIVERRAPEISRTTTYRTLETLVRLGMITKVCHPGRTVRYDRRTEIHHHLVCLTCDDVIDISDDALDALRLPDTSAHGFQVRDHRVQLRGICRRCLEAGVEAPGSADEAAGSEEVNTERFSE